MSYNNVVPRNDLEGSLGTPQKRWADIFAKKITVDEFNIAQEDIGYRNINVSNEATVEKLIAANATITEGNAKKLTITNVTITEGNAEKLTITNAAITTATISTLNSTNIKSTNVNADKVDSKVVAINGEALSPQWHTKMAGQTFAHRGYGWHFSPIPQNTLMAFKCAADNGFSAIETDVQTDKNGNIVCIHDKDISTITDKTGAISSYDYTNVHVLDAYGNVTNENPCLFTDALTLCKKCGMKLSVEIKYNGSTPLANITTVMDLCKAYGVPYYLQINEDDWGKAIAHDENVILVTSTFSNVTPTEAQVAAYKNKAKHVCFYHTDALSAATKALYEKYGFLCTCDENRANADNWLDTNTSYIRGNVCILNTGWRTLKAAQITTGVPSDDASYAPMYIRADNTVHVKGILNDLKLNNLPVSSSTRPTLFTLPQGFRPARYTRLVVPLSSSTLYLAELRISTNGDVVIFATNAPNVNVLNAGLSIDFSLICNN